MVPLKRLCNFWLERRSSEDMCRSSVQTQQCCLAQKSYKEPKGVQTIWTKGQQDISWKAKEVSTKNAKLTGIACGWSSASNSAGNTNGVLSWWHRIPESQRNGNHKILVSTMFSMWLTNMIAAANKCACDESAQRPCGAAHWFDWRSVLNWWGQAGVGWGLFFMTQRHINDLKRPPQLTTSRGPTMCVQLYWYFLTTACLFWTQNWPSGKSAPLHFDSVDVAVVSCNEKNQFDPTSHASEQPSPVIEIWA